MLRLNWEYEESRDKEFSFARWDFVALHKEGSPHEEYDASRWIYGRTNGTAILTAPLEPGRYSLTAVRDAKYVLMVMRETKVDPSHIERYCCGVDENKTEDFHILGKTGFVVVEEPAVSVEAAQRPVGKTGSNPEDWHDDHPGVTRRASLEPRRKAQSEGPIVMAAGLAKKLLDSRRRHGPKWL